MKICRHIVACVLAITLSVCPLISCGDRIDLDDIVVKDSDWAVGAPLPQASDFVVDMPENVRAEFAVNYVFDSVGVYELHIVLKRGLSRSERTVRMNLRQDNTPPIISGVKDIGVHIGEGVSYKSGVVVTDDCGGVLTLSVDSTGVDLTKEGQYYVRYIAKDAVGNVATAKAKVYVTRLEVTEAMLNAKLDTVIASIITPNMSREEQCRAVYNYVFNKIQYTSDSEKGDWIRAAYYGIDRGLGDCYTYFSLSKALLTRLGIENMEIQRTSAASAEMGETHYWNYVNVGDAENPQWYHFDTTHLRDQTYNGKIVLVTDEQLRYYNEQVREAREHGTFYAYDRVAYPASATARITKLPYEG
jgi:hypothetical protein